MQALQAPTGLCHSPDLVAQSPRVPILALAAVGKSVERHAFPMDTLVAMAGAIHWLVTVQAPPASLTVAHRPWGGVGLANAM